MMIVSLAFLQFAFILLNRFWAQGVGTGCRGILAYELNTTLELMTCKIYARHTEANCPLDKNPLPSNIRCEKGNPEGLKRLIIFRFLCFGEGYRSNNCELIDAERHEKGQRTKQYGNQTILVSAAKEATKGRLLTMIKEVENNDKPSQLSLKDLADSSILKYSNVVDITKDEINIPFLLPLRFGQPEPCPETKDGFFVRVSAVSGGHTLSRKEVTKLSMGIYLDVLKSSTGRLNVKDVKSYMTRYEGAAECSRENVKIVSGAAFGKTFIGTYNKNNEGEVALDATAEPNSGSKCEGMIRQAIWTLCREGATDEKIDLNLEFTDMTSSPTKNYDFSRKIGFNAYSLQQGSKSFFFPADRMGGVKIPFTPLNTNKRINATLLIRWMHSTGFDVSHLELIGLKRYGENG